MVDPVASSETQQLLIDVADNICQSSQPSIQLMGAELRDYAIFAGEDSQSLATEIGLNDPDAIERGMQFIEKVADDARFGETAYSQAISLAELLERMGHRESLRPAVGNLVQSVRNVQPVKAQQTIQKILDEFLQRWQLTGKPFRLEATNSQTGGDLSSCAGKVVVIIFYDAASQSTQTMETTLVRSPAMPKLNLSRVGR